MNRIKEGFDYLPIAVCFFDSNGVVRLINHRMLSVGLALLGSGIQTLEELHCALNAPPAGIAQPNKSLPVYYFPDGKALRFEEKIIFASNGAKYTQVIAADVTELMNRYAELERDNARLEDSNRRAKRLYDQMPEIVREEEILTMKMRIHDDIGHSILSSRKTLLTAESIDEIKKGCAVWEKVARLLNDSGSGSAPEDPIEYTANRAKNIGVELLINGDLPKDYGRRYIFSLAIRESITNCVRHAGGTKVFVQSIPFGNIHIIIITNNGIVPKKTVTEGGGLSSLRRRVERSGGSMSVQSFPCFALTVRLPKTEDEL